MQPTTEELSAKAVYEIRPVHGVRDADKLTAICLDMRSNGWSGRPVLAVQDGYGVLYALTGSHRIVAAHHEQIDVEVLAIAGLSDDAREDLINANEDDERMCALTGLGIPQDAIDLMQVELDNNEEEDMS